MPCRRRARSSGRHDGDPGGRAEPEAAYALINFMMDPEITADITNYV